MVVKNILFIGLSSVGDVVMTTPVLQSLHNKYPKASFDIVSDNRSVALYESYPYKNKLYLKDKDKPLRGVPDLLLKLWKKRYDIIVDVRTDGLAYLLRSKKRYTKWFANSYGPHAVEDLLGVVSSLHGNDPIPHTQVWLSDSNRDYAIKQISVFKNKEKLLAISVGDPDKPFKTWPNNKFIELLKRHKNDFSGIIFLGGDSETENTLQVAGEIDIPYINAAGNSLLEAAALIEKSCLYIGPDSGLGHIASALKIPTISLFSQVSPERFRPWGDKAVCIRGENNDARNISVDIISSAVRSHR
jgi:lipopolysaccharide heptosyltransferase III